MLCESDFQLHSNELTNEVDRNIFTVLLRNDREVLKSSRYSVTRACKPLSYLSSIIAMKQFRYVKNGIKRLNNFNKLHTFIVITLFLLLSYFVRPVSIHQSASDVPLNLLTTAFTICQTFELIFAVFIVTFHNSKYYVYFYQIMDNIDAHFGHSKHIYRRRVILALFMALCPCLIVCSLFVIQSFNLRHVISYITFVFVNFHGFNCIFVTVIIYMQVLVFNVALMQKVRNISPSKMITFKDDWFTAIFKILIMFNSWLLVTIVVLCRSLTPALKYSSAIKLDLYYYTFINLRPLFVTKISELLKHENRKTLLTLIHVLVYEDNYYHDQIRTMIELVESKSLMLSAVICPVNISIMFSFAGRVVSYAILFIQNFYINN